MESFSNRNAEASRGNSISRATFLDGFETEDMDKCWSSHHLTYAFLTRSFPKSRKELVVLLPELFGPKCLNGVSWLMYETPMVLLDESTTCFDISLQEDSVTLDLLTYVE